MTDSALSIRSHEQSRDSALLSRLMLPTLANAPPADWRLAALATIGFFALLLPTAPSLFADGDMFWHIRTGQEILATGQFPTVDSYSWSMTGHAWIAKEWLSQVLYALAFDMAGWSGVAILALAAASCAYGIVFAAVERRAGAAVALVCVLVIAMAGNFHLLARPHVLAWPVTVLFSAKLLDAAERGRAPHWSTAVLVTLWANLHGSFLLGFIILPFFAWEALARTTAARGVLALRWGLFGLACLGAAMIHPYGLGVLVAARQVLTLGPALAMISEWRPQNFSAFGHFEFILLLGLGAALLTGLRLPAPRLILLLALLHSMLSHVRQETPGLMIVALLIGAPAAELGAGFHLPREKRSLVVFIVLAVAAVIGGSALRKLPPTLPEETAPQAALTAARAAGVKGNVLNDDHFAGYLINQHVPTYVDGRAEMFGMMHRDLSLAIAGQMPEKLAALLADPRIGWTLLPSEMPANQTLAASPGWRLIYRDRIATVYARIR